METSLHKKLLDLKQQLWNLTICFVIRREGMILDANKLWFQADTTGRTTFQFKHWESSSACRPGRGEFAAFNARLLVRSRSSYQLHNNSSSRWSFNIFAAKQKPKSITSIYALAFITILSTGALGFPIWMVYCKERCIASQTHMVQPELCYENWIFSAADHLRQTSIMDSATDQMAIEFC
jgi:hypothetical protein